MSERTFSVRRGLVLGFVALGILCGGLFGWGAFASLSGAVIATGRVEAEGGDRAVEHVDGGAVAAIPARNGDRVAAGEVLVRIDGALLRSEASVLEAELFDLVARRNRLEAEFRDAEDIRWDPVLTSAVETDPAVRAAVDGHRRLFAARLATRAGFVTQLRERIDQTRRQIAGFEAQGQAVSRQLRLLGEELEAQRSLLEKGLTRKPVVLALEREMAALEGQAGDIAARVAAALGRIAELETQILQIGSRRIEEAETETREVQARENAVRERLAGLRVRIGRLEVRAPVAGIVHDLAVSAVGEVLQPGETVAKVVPEEARFTVTAQLEPIHVDQVWPGQEAVLRFSAFSARSTPEYGGTVTRVSADAMTDERSGISWYEVEFAIGRPVEPDAGTGPDAWIASAKAAIASWLGSGGNAPAQDPAQSAVSDAPLALAPGMPVEAYLRTGERSPLSYLVKPLTDYFERSLREE